MPAYTKAINAYKKHDESRELIPAFFQTNSRFFQLSNCVFYLPVFSFTGSVFVFPSFLPSIYMTGSEIYSRQPVGFLRISSSSNRLEMPSKSCRDRLLKSAEIPFFRKRSFSDFLFSASFWSVFHCFRWFVFFSIF